MTTFICDFAWCKNCSHFLDDICKELYRVFFFIVDVTLVFRCLNDINRNQVKFLSNFVALSCSSFWDPRNADLRGVITPNIFCLLEHPCINEVSESNPVKLFAYKRFFFFPVTETAWVSSILGLFQAFDSHSVRWLTGQVNVPLPGSTYAMWGELGTITLIQECGEVCQTLYLGWWRCSQVQALARAIFLPRLYE